MKEEEFKKKWHDFESESHSKGELGIEGWNKMCQILNDFVVEKGYYPKEQPTSGNEAEFKETDILPKEGDIITNPLHLACIEGVKIGYKMAVEKQKELDKKNTIKKIEKCRKICEEPISPTLAEYEIFSVLNERYVRVKDILGCEGHHVTWRQNIDSEYDGPTMPPLEIAKETVKILIDEYENVFVKEEYEDITHCKL